MVMEQTNKKIEGQKRGTFILDETRTPADNIAMMMKLAFPLEVTMSKLTNSNFYLNNNSGIRVNNIEIFAAEHDRSITTVYDTKRFKRLVVRAQIPGAYGRNARRYWTLAIKENKKVSLAWLVKIFNELYTMYKAADEKTNIEKAKQDAEKTRMATLKTECMLDNHKNTSMGYYSYNSTYSLSIGNLTEEQIKVVGPAIDNVLRPLGL